MADKRRTGVAIALGSALFGIALLIGALGLVLTSELRETLDWYGTGTTGLLPLQGLLVLTMAFYALSFAVPHTRLALLQGIATTVFGIVMIVGGIVLAVVGVARFVGLVTLLLSFPFGTIAYFIEYSCGGDGPLGGGCMGGMQLGALIALVSKLGALACLILLAPGFVKVRGLLVAVALGAAMAAVVVGAIWMLGDFHFLLYPADALVTAVLGIVAAVYGIVTFVKSLLALALAIAGQVA